MYDALTTLFLFIISNYYSQSSAVSIPSITVCVPDEAESLGVVELAPSSALGVLLSELLDEVTFDEFDELSLLDDDSNGPFICEEVSLSPLP